MNIRYEEINRVKGIECKTGVRSIINIERSGVCKNGVCRNGVYR